MGLLPRKPQQGGQGEGGMGGGTENRLMLMILQKVPLRECVCTSAPGVFVPSFPPTPPLQPFNSHSAPEALD